jgi:hydroxylamine reductase
VDFDPARFTGLINRAVALRDALKQKVKSAGGDTTAIDTKAQFKPETTVQGLVSQGEKVGLKTYPADNDDIRSLKHILLFGIKGVAAYAYHAEILGKEDDAVYTFNYEALAAIADAKLGLNELLPLVLKCGEMNLKAMELLDAANTGAYGHPVPTKVSLGAKKARPFSFQATT